MVVSMNNKDEEDKEKDSNPDIDQKQREAFYKYLEFQNKRYDTELQLFWQRSVFVSAFLVLILTGYGALLIRIVESKDIKTVVDLLSNTLLNSLASVLCTVGIIMSYIWFRIARGSKGTYQAVEGKIYSSKYQISETLQKYMDRKDLWLNSEFYSSEDSFNFDQGPYSPTKLNIILIFFFMVLFSVLLFVHLMALFFCDFMLFLVFATANLLFLLVFILIVRHNSISWWQIKK